MNYKPDINQRKSIQLNGKDYTQPKLYFITICCANLLPRFGKIEAEKVLLDEIGQIAYDEWLNLPQRFSNCELHEFIIMPNHMHGIVHLVETEDKSSSDKSISDIIATYKSSVSAECLKIYKLREEIMGKLWQRDYDQRIIGDQSSFEKISKNIINNPSRWHSDEFFTI